jgi:hypothetical protein
MVHGSVVTASVKIHVSITEVINLSNINLLC